MAVTRQGNAQIAVVLNAMKAVKNHYPKHISEVIAQINQLSINNRRRLFATTGKNSMLQLALRGPSGDYLAYMLEQHANDPSLPLDVDLILLYTREHRAIYSRKWSTSPLWLAAREKKVSVVASLLARGADANDKLTGQTPLHACLYKPGRSADTLRIAEMLMEHNADLTCTSSNDATPLMLAASNHPILVTSILERVRAAGHDVSKFVLACDNRERTALHYATGGNRNARFSHADVEVVTSLCKEGADLYCMPKIMTGVTRLCLPATGLQRLAKVSTGLLATSGQGSVTGLACFNRLWSNSSRCDNSWALKPH